MSLRTLFGRAQPPDGASPALETIATGISPAFLDSAAEAASQPRRRELVADPGSATIDDALGQKLIHFFLQNRHQTLVPLTLNLRVLSPEQRAVVTDALAALLLAGRPPAEAAPAIPALRAWLESLGADPAMLADLERALDAPQPLHAVFERAQALNLTVYAYVAALVAADPRFPASQLLCDVVQARFDLSSAVVRSATRRYRR